MREGVGCVPPLETALRMKGRCLHGKKGEIRKLQLIKVNTHTNNYLSWNWAPSHYESKCFSQDKLLSDEFSACDSFSSRTTCLCVVTIFSWTTLCLVDAVTKGLLSITFSSSLLQYSEAVMQGSILLQTHCVSLGICISQEWIIFTWTEGQNSHLLPQKCKIP